MNPPQLNLILKQKTYAWLIASVGQIPAHVPQSIHVPASISLFPSTSLIAETGHSGSQDPQLTQASEILYAMLTPPIKYMAR